MLLVEMLSETSQRGDLLAALGALFFTPTVLLTVTLPEIEEFFLFLFVCFQLIALPFLISAYFFGIFIVFLAPNPAGLRAP